MTKNVITIKTGEGAVRAAQLMKKHRIGSIVVVDSKSAKGIVTERDIVHRLVAEGKDPADYTVDKVMSKPIRVIKPKSSVEDAAKAMRDNGIKRLPVVNEKNELVGILSEGDIMKIFPAVVDLIEEKARL